MVLIKYILDEQGCHRLAIRLGKIASVKYAGGQETWLHREIGWWCICHILMILSPHKVSKAVESEESIKNLSPHFSTLC